MKVSTEVAVTVLEYALLLPVICMLEEEALVTPFRCLTDLISKPCMGITRLVTISGDLEIMIYKP